MLHCESRRQNLKAEKTVKTRLWEKQQHPEISCRAHKETALLSH